MFNSKEDFDKIYSFSFDKVYTFAFCLTESHTSATSITFETFEKLFEDSKNFDDEKQVLNHILHLADYFAFNHISHKKKSYLYLNNTANVNSDEPSLSDMNKNFLVHIASLALTTRELKEVFVLKFFLHLQDEDIAEILHTSQKAVRVNLSRARMLVRSQYEKSSF